ncbi:MAG: ribosomal protein S18-alanine N-acetyltransferase [Candidatus Binatia bacterium]|nr:ribosomal protein S18-alanine N-acetyltransferase [Candidatus Binatia bacterium]
MCGPTPRVSVRPMVESDLFRVAAIEREAFSRPGARERLAKEIELPQSRPRVALIGDRAVGYLIYWQVTDEFQLLDIAVKKEFRGIGVAGSLLGHLLDEADALLGSTVHLEVSAANDSAIRLYAAHGFIEVGQRANYYGPGEDALVLVRDAK